MKNKWILFVIVFVVLCIFLSISLKNNDNKLFLGNRKIEEQLPLQFQQLNRLYTSFGDDFSKKLFFAKLEEDLKGSFLPMLKIMLSPEFERFTSDLSSIAEDEAVSNILDYLKRRKSGRGCYIFGSQYGLLLGSEYINCLKTLGIKFISVVIKDNQNPEVKKLKNVFPDINIIRENDFLNNYKNEDIILSSIDWKKGKNWLIKNGISRDKIVVLFDFFCPQYFPKDIMIPKEHEIFIDGGAFNMDSSIDFINWCNGKYDYIYAFEPDLNSYKNCKNVIQDNDVFDREERIMLYNKGLFDQATQLRFNSDQDNPFGSCISNDGESIINTVSIDEALDGKPATLIKMDIEGCELKALIGAKNTIRKYKPRLVISIYHKPSDIIDIPLYILSLVPEYKLYIRHYSTASWETVLYCVCD